ncbi:MAG: nicotinamide riboside transporter PnuC [Pseudomonadota bacterium]
MSTTLVLQWLAVVGAIAYLGLVIRESILCWWFAGASSAIYVYLTWQVNLVGQAALNAFYVAMAAYGYWRWRGGQSNDDSVPVVRWSLGIHGVALLAIAGGTLLVTASRNALTSSELTMIDSVGDSATTLAAIWTTYLVARKELNSWFYWVVIDIATIVLFVRQGLTEAALPFAIYLVMIPFGYIAWRRTYELQTNAV